MATLKALQAAAKELNTTLGLEPAINVKAKEDQLVELIKEAVGYIEPTDEVSDETQAVIDELTAPPAKDKKKAAAPAAKKAAKVAEPEPEEEDEIEENEADEEADDEIEDEEVPEEKVDYSELIESVEAAAKVKDLKVLVDANDVFKSKAKDLKAIKDADELREEMLDILDDAAATEEAEEIEEVVAPVKKGGKKEAAAPTKAAPKVEIDITPTKHPLKEKLQTEKRAADYKEKKAAKPVKAVKGPSPYGTAVEVMCTNPDQSVTDLINALKKKKIDVEVGLSAIRTGYGSVRKIVSLLRANKLMK
jgi:hypothetical protein